MTWQPEIDEIHQREALAHAMGGAEKVAKHHTQGRMTVRERIEILLDPGTFHETGVLAGSAEYSEGKLTAFRPANFVMGTGLIDGRKVVVGGDDFTVRGGAADAAVMGKQVYSEQLANSLRIPVVRLVDGTGGGGSVKMLEQHGYTYVPANPGWDYVVDNMSLVPVVAACLGSVAGLGAARLAASHFSVMVEGISQLFVAGPPVVKSGMGEDLTKEELGGAQIHRYSGAVDVVVQSEQEAFTQMRRFLSYLPQNVFELPPIQPSTDPIDRRDESLLNAIPRNRRQPYRIRPILASLFDADSILELAHYGRATLTALARLDGHPVGVVAADPYFGGGGLTAEGADAMSFIAVIAVGSESKIGEMTTGQYRLEAGKLSVAEPMDLVLAPIGDAVPFLFSSMLIRGRRPRRVLDRQGMPGPIPRQRDLGGNQNPRLRPRRQHLHDRRARRTDRAGNLGDLDADHRRHLPRTVCLGRISRGDDHRRSAFGRVHGQRRRCVGQCQEDDRGRQAHAYDLRLPRHRRLVVRGRRSPRLGRPRGLYPGSVSALCAGHGTSEIYDVSFEPSAASWGEK